MAAAAPPAASVSATRRRIAPRCATCAAATGSPASTAIRHYPVTAARAGAHPTARIASGSVGTAFRGSLATTSGDGPTGPRQAPLAPPTAAVTTAAVRRGPSATAPATGDGGAGGGCRGPSLTGPIAGARPTPIGTTSRLSTLLGPGAPPGPDPLATPTRGVTVLRVEPRPCGAAPPGPTTAPAAATTARPPAASLDASTEGAGGAARRCGAIHGKARSQGGHLPVPARAAWSARAPPRRPV